MAAPPTSRRRRASKGGGRPPQPALTSLSPVQRYAEERLGRPLTAGELAIDIEKIDRILNTAKDNLTAAIEQERTRAIRARLRNRTVTLEITPEMTRILNGLQAAGEQEALAEIQRLIGSEVPNRRTYAELPGPLILMRELLKAMLGQIRTRILRETVSLEITPSPSAEMIEKLEKVIPGARDAASRLVSGAFTSGLANTYEAHADLFPCWQYTAVMDNATCQPCREWDGQRFSSLPQLYAVLPNFGPNPRCLGDGRCRCRGVPCALSEMARTWKPSELFLPHTNNEQLNAEVRATLQDMDELVKVTTTRGKTLPIYPFDDPDHDPSNHAGYSYDKESVPYAMFVNPAPTSDQHRRASIYHEFWHHLDHMHLGPPQPWKEGQVVPFATDRAALGDFDGIEAGQEIADLLDALRRSRPSLLLQHVYDNDPIVQRSPEALQHIDYLLRPKEITARAFAQWVVTRRGDEDAWANMLPLTGRGYWHYWDPDDFAEIAAAFDAIFEKLGWRP